MRRRDTRRRDIRSRAASRWTSRTARRGASLSAALVLGAVAVLAGGAGLPASATPLPPLPPTPVSGPVDQVLQQLVSYLVAQCTPSAVAALPALAGPCESVAEQAGTQAYLYGIAPMEFLRQRRQQTSVTVPNDLSDAPVNQFGSARELATTAPGHQVFVQPNNDTLYTMAHLDLAHRTLVLHVPRMGPHRYYVMQFLDPYTNVFAYVGTRTTGNGAHDYLLVGPHWHGRTSSRLPVIRSPYDLAWIAGRTLVAGPSDLPAVHRIQDRYRLIPRRAFVRQGLRWRPPTPSVVRTQHVVATEPGGLAFFDGLGDALATSPPPAADKPVLDQLKAIGIGPGLHPSSESLSDPVKAGLAKAADEGRATVTSARTTYAAVDAVQHHGWFVPPADTGDFGTDYQWRAIVALFGLAANRPAEAVYTVGVTDQLSQQLDGANRYVIHFPATGLPPARFFWSLTMYDANFYLVPNAIGRYALGNRSPSLVYNADGSLDLYLSHTAPAGHEGNWLPAPASGHFEVTLRMYGPGPTVLADTYSYPSIQRQP